MVHFSVSCAGKLSNIRPTLSEASEPRGTCEKAMEGQMRHIDENSRTALNMTLCGGLRLPLFCTKILCTNIARTRDHLNRKLCSKELGKGLDPQLSAVYCAHRVQNLLREEAHHVCESSRRGIGAGSCRQFSRAGRESLSHH